jgi:hypothetical protein
MLTLSYDNFLSEIEAASKTRVQHEDGTFSYVGQNAPLYPAEHSEQELEETKKVMNIEKYGIDKHFKTHHGKVPPPLVLPNPVTENVAKRIILRLSREFRATIEISDTNTTISFFNL